MYILNTHNLQLGLLTAYNSKIAKEIIFFKFHESQSISNKNFLISLFGLYKNISWEIAQVFHIFLESRHSIKDSMI